jgi:molybdopterin synthase catalytic subunit/molybdopterin converting factor small subunit
VNVRLLLFAAAADRAGTDRAVLETPGPLTVGAVRRLAAERYPGLAALLPACALAVDGAYAGDDLPVPDGAEVAVIPPVSGGAGRPEPITDAAVRLEPLLEASVGADPAEGGHVLFVGTVRGTTDGHVTERLEYACYRPMAERLIGEICDRAEADHPGARVAAQHRVGSLRPGDIAVAVVASAPHRAEAFAACRDAIEAIKREVPIWKREFGPDGSAWLSGEPAAPPISSPSTPPA